MEAPTLYAFGFRRFFVEKNIARVIYVLYDIIKFLGWLTFLLFIVQA